METGRFLIDLCQFGEPSIINGLPIVEKPRWEPGEPKPQEPIGIFDRQLSRLGHIVGYHATTQVVEPIIIAVRPDEEATREAVRASSQAIDELLQRLEGRKYPRMRPVQEINYIPFYKNDINADMQQLTDIVELGPEEKHVFVFFRGERPREILAA